MSFRHNDFISLPIYSVVGLLDHMVILISDSILYTVLHNGCHFFLSQLDYIPWNFPFTQTLGYIEL